MDYTGIDGKHERYNTIGSLYHYAKFGYDRCSSFNYMTVSIFGSFSCKAPIHAPKIVFIVHFTLQMAYNINERQKAHPDACESASFHSFEPSSVKIWRAV